MFVQLYQLVEFQMPFQYYGDYLYIILNQQTNKQISYLFFVFILKNKSQQQTIHFYYQVQRFIYIYIEKHQEQLTRQQPIYQFIRNLIINYMASTLQSSLQPHSQSNLQIYEMFTSLFVTISKGQQIIDSIKQVLTTYQLFHPLVLFKYITKNNPILTRKHLLAFLQQNNYLATQQDIKIIFSFQGVKDKMNYSTFLKMIYPYGNSANREISSMNLKNYYSLEKLNVSIETLTCFYLLITEQIELINRIQVQKKDSLNLIPKEKIHKVIKNIKKLSQKSSAHCEDHPDVISSLELIYFIKNFTDIDDSSLLYLIRRLGTDHLGSIQIERLESFIKPWKKKTNQRDQNVSTFVNKQNLLDESLNVSIHKKFNEEKYRKQLNAQLSRNVSQKKNQTSTKRKNRKQGTIKIKQGQLCNKKSPNNFIGVSSSKKQSRNNSPLKTPVKQFSKETKRKQKQSHRPNGNNVKLFMKFISVFLKNSSEIQRLKKELNRNSQINYLKIFKNLDKKQRGVITAQQLQEYYQQIGGVSVSINFTVLINAFSQTSQNWLSYSQFCQILKPSIQRSFASQQKQTPQSSSRQYTGIHQQNRLISQIIYLNLLNQYQLLQLRRQFNKQQLFHLFSLINKEQTGFINYQQLKHFLNEINFTSLSMYELMLILKRLDRSKNGVVSENQFVNYFLVEM